MLLKVKSGFTIMEILVVLTILILVFLIILPQFKLVREQQAFKSAVEDVLSVLDKAHSQSLASVDSAEYGVHFTSNNMVLFKGTSYSSNDPNNQNIAVTSPVSISNISLSGGAEDVYFDRLKGLPSATGTITISTASYSKIITISATGSFSTN